MHCHHHTDRHILCATRHQYVPASKMWLHGPPQLCSQMTLIWLIHFAGFHNHDQREYMQEQPTSITVRLCGSAIYKPSDNIHQKS